MKVLYNPWIITIIGSAVAAVLAGLFLKGFTKRNADRQDVFKDKHAAYSHKGSLAGAKFYDKAGRKATFVGHAAEDASFHDQSVEDAKFHGCAGKDATFSDESGKNINAR